MTSPTAHVTPFETPVARPATAARIVALAFTAFAVGYAIHRRDGEYELVAIRWIVAALASVVLAVLVPPLLPRGSPRRYWASLAEAAVFAVAIGQFALLLLGPPSGWNPWSNDLLNDTPGNLRIYDTYLTAAAALLLLTLLASGSPRLESRCWWKFPFVALLVFHLLSGVWLIRSSPKPDIDVFVFQQEGAERLLSGRDPYAPGYRDIYFGTDKNTDRQVYGQGMAQLGKTAFGFPYPPLSLYLSTLGYEWSRGHDHRYAQAFAFTLAGALLAFARPGRWGAVAATVLLFTPRAFFILGRAWTEPFVLLMLAATLLTACRRPRWVFLPLGLFLASKQYLVFALPLAWLLLSDRQRSSWRAAARPLLLALLVAAAVSLPLMLRNFQAFWNSTVTVQEASPFRTDALSLLVWYFQKTGVQPGATLAFVAAIGMTALCLWQCPRTPSGFATALAAVYLPFIALNKQAFANYYLFVIGAAVAALAVMQPWERSPKAEPDVRPAPQSPASASPLLV